MMSCGADSGDWRAVLSSLLLLLLPDRSGSIVGSYGTTALLEKGHAASRGEWTPLPRGRPMRGGSRGSVAGSGGVTPTSPA